MSNSSQITLEDKIAAEDFAKLLQQFPSSEKEHWYFMIKGAKLAYSSMEQSIIDGQKTA